jgi:hypothetical protein
MNEGIEGGLEEQLQNYPLDELFLITCMKYETCLMSDLEIRDIQIPIHSPLGIFLKKTQDELKEIGDYYIFNIRDGLDLIEKGIIIKQDVFSFTQKENYTRRRGGEFLLEMWDTERGSEKFSVSSTIIAKEEFLRRMLLYFIIVSINEKQTFFSGNEKDEESSEEIIQSIKKELEKKK